MSKMTSTQPTPESEVIEAVKAELSPLVNEDMDPAMRDAWLTDLALASLSALSRQGLCAVPREPTEAANRWRNQWGEAMAALEGVLSIPALNQVLGTKHTADCDCPLCRARALLQPQPERSEYLDEKDRT